MLSSCHHFPSLPSVPSLLPFLVFCPYFERLTEGIAFHHQPVRPCAGSQICSQLVLPAASSHTRSNCSRHSLYTPAPPKHHREWSSPATISQFLQPQLAQCNGAGKRGVFLLGFGGETTGLYPVNTGGVQWCLWVVAEKGGAVQPRVGLGWFGAGRQLGQRGGSEMQPRWGWNGRHPAGGCAGELRASGPSL